MSDLEEWSRYMGERRREPDDELTRLRRYAKETGSTYWPCEVCGHGRNSRGCLWCERDALKAEVEQLRSCLCLTEREQKAAWRMIRDGEGPASARVAAGIVDDAEWEACRLKLARLGLPL